MLSCYCPVLLSYCCCATVQCFCRAAVVLLSCYCPVLLSCILCCCRATHQCCLLSLLRELVDVAYFSWEHLLAGTIHLQLIVTPMQGCCSAGLRSPWGQASCAKHGISCAKHLISCAKHHISCAKNRLSCAKHLHVLILLNPYRAFAKASPLPLCFLSLLLSLSPFLSPCWSLCPSSSTFSLSPFFSFSFSPSFIFFSLSPPLLVSPPCVGLHGAGDRKDAVYCQTCTTPAYSYPQSISHRLLSHLSCNFSSRSTSHNSHLQRWPLSPQ